MFKRFFSLLLFSLFFISCSLHTVYAETYEPNEDVPEIIPLNKPNMKDSQLENWVRKVVVLPYQYDADNFRERWALTEKNFTAQGWEKFQRTLRQTGNTDHLSKSNIVVDAKIKGKVMIVGRGVADGHYFWKVAVPLYISYAGRSLTRGQHALAVLIIVRVDKSTAQNGIAIAQYSTSIRSLAHLPNNSEMPS